MLGDILLYRINEYQLLHNVSGTSCRLANTWHCVKKKITPHDARDDRDGQFSEVLKWFWSSGS